MDGIALENLDRDLVFKIKLQVALRKNALKIRDLSGDPVRFDRYINERESKIKGLLGTETIGIILEDGKQIFP